MKLFKLIVLIVFLCVVSSVTAIVITWEQSAKALSTEKLNNALVIYSKINQLEPTEDVILTLKQEISCGVEHYWIIHKMLRFYKPVSSDDKALLEKAESLSSEPCSWKNKLTTN